MNTTTRHPAARSAADTAIAAERQRARSLLALGRQRGVDPTLVEAMIDAGTSVEAARASIVVGENREAFRPFATLGEQLRAVRRHAETGALDPRLRLAAGTPSGMNQSVDSEGGFLLQTNFLDAIMTRAYMVGAILSRVRELPFGEAQNLKLIAWDDTNRADGQRLGGVSALWLSEADQFTSSKPKPRTLELSAAKKVIALWHVTNELQADSPAATQAAEEGFAQEISFVLEDKIVNGKGAGTPLGIASAPALITNAIESTQTIANSAQFIGLNMTKMFARCFASRDPSAVAWLVNAELLPTLYAAQLPATSGTAVVPLVDFDAPNSVGYGSALGRPIIPAEYCQAVGTPGDIILTDLAEYVIATKDVAGARSAHLKFLTDESSYRLVLRVDGQPVWSKAVTPKNGSNIVSPYVVLGTRS